MPKFRNAKERFIESIPLLGIIILILVSSLLVSSGHPDLAIKGTLTIGTPLIFASLLLFLRRHSVFNENIYKYHNFISLPSIRCLILLFTQIYIASIIILILYSKRPFIYFLLFASLGVIFFVEVIFLKPHLVYIRSILILQILSLLLISCFGVVFKYPLYIGHTDVLIHMNYIYSILSTGNITSMMGQYQDFPLFHVLNSIIYLICGLNVKTNIFLLSFLVFSLGTILIYLISIKVTNNVNISILAALIFIFSRPIVFASLALATGTLSYIICLMVLYLLIIGKTDIRFRVLSIILIPFLVLNHQISLVMFLGMLIFLMFAGFFFQHNDLISSKYLLLFSGSFISYWVYICGPFFYSIIGTIISTNEPVVISASAESIMSQVTPTWISFIKSIDYTFIVFFSLFASFVMIRQSSNRLGQVFGLSSIIFIPLFIPAIADMLKAFVGYRLPLFVSPFVAIAASVGIYNSFVSCAENRTYVKLTPILLLILFLGYFLSSPFLEARFIDNDSFANELGQFGRAYFNQAEINSFYFSINHKDRKDIIYSDSQVFRYTSGFLSEASSYRIDVFDIENLHSSTYFIFRKAEYLSVGYLNFLLEYKSDRGFNPSVSATRKLNVDPFPGDVWSTEEFIYDNGDVNLFYKII